MLDAAITPEVAADLIKLQSAVSKLDFPKTVENPHFHSKYCPLEVVMEKVLPVVHANGFALVQAAGWVEGITPTPTLATVLIHKTGYILKGEMLTLPKKENDQQQGAAITFARRYAVQCLLGITPEEDKDGNGPVTTNNPVDTSTSGQNPF